MATNAKPEGIFGPLQRPDADALETLWQRAERAKAAFKAALARVEAGGQVTRVGEDVWLQLRAPATAPRDTDAAP